MMSKTDFFRKDMQKQQEFGINKATKEQAILYGFKFYWTGKECANGHLTYRYVSSDKCRQCSLDACKIKNGYGKSEEELSMGKVRAKIEDYKLGKEEDWWGD